MENRHIEWIIVPVNTGNIAAIHKKIAKKACICGLFCRNSTKRGNKCSLFSISIGLA
jgi:hypothetical protein